METNCAPQREDIATARRRCFVWSAGQSRACARQRESGFAYLTWLCLYVSSACCSTPAVQCRVWACVASCVAFEQSCCCSCLQVCPARLAEGPTHKSERRKTYVESASLTFIVTWSRALRLVRAAPTCAPGGPRLPTRDTVPSGRRNRYRLRLENVPDAYSTG